MERKLLITIVALSVLGLAISGYSLAHHQSFVSGAFCNINSSFSCDIVNRGPFSQIYGIPVALIGLVGYGFLLAAALMRLKRPSDPTLLTFLIVTATGGFGFALYLSGIEAFVLKSWCVLCLTSQAAILGIMGAAGYLKISEIKRPRG
jgi:uncharacterized membrane protein